jgi:oxygen-dependent protoporphyrinogen oxidase
MGKIVAGEPRRIVSFRVSDRLRSPTPMPQRSTPRHVIVIGAGMAGLAAAEAASGDMAADGKPRVTVVESSGRAGGVLATVRRDGWLVERSADTFLAARPEAIGIARRIGLEPEFVGVDPAVRRALIWGRGRAFPAPDGFRLLAPSLIGGILGTPLLSAAGRLRVLAEPFVPVRRPPPGDDDESLEAFVVRRLGREAFERLVQPLAAGIWTADPARLSMAAACPEFLAMERESGSLWRGERSRRRTADRAGAVAGARYGQFLTFAGGIETLPARLADVLRERGVRFVHGSAAAVTRVPDGGWRVTFAAEEPTPLTADAVVIATPAPAAARLLAGADPALSRDLAAIEYAGSAVVSLGFRRSDVAHPLDAAGMVVPRTAGRSILAVSFSSAKFPGRAPPGCVLLRVFVGGALDPEAVACDDAALVDRARHELATLVGVRGEPLLEQVDRWHAAMPQYHVGHLGRVAAIEAAAERLGGLALAGAAYRGVGIPQVIASGRAAAELVMRPGR